MKKILHLETDGLITDDPLLARSTLNALSRDYLLEFLLEVLYP